MADGEDIPPPLEDMSELLAQVETLKEKPMFAQDRYNRQTETNTTTSNSKPSVNCQEEDVKYGKCDLEASPKKVAASTTETHNSSGEGTTFGGFKKGFLFANSPSKSKVTDGNNKAPATKKAVNSDIPLIKPKDPSAKDKQHQLSEVQEAMALGQTIADQKDQWLTDDLLKKIQQNKSLMEKMADPALMQAVAEFHTNPQGAAEKYKFNTEVQLFLKDFSALMGDHLTSAADTLDSPQDTAKPAVATTDDSKQADISVHSSTNPKQATAEDEEQMKRILADTQVRDCLMDPCIQQLIEGLRTDPHKAQSVLRSAGADLQKKVKMLVDAGLLQFQR